MKPHMKHRSHSGGSQKIRYGLSPMMKLADPTEEVYYAIALDSTEFCNSESGDSATLVDLSRADAGFLRTFCSSWGFLNRAERNDILRYFGFILWENSSGFITFEHFKVEGELTDRWKEVQEAFYPEDESVDGSEWEDSPHTA